MVRLGKSNEIYRSISEPIDLNHQQCLPWLQFMQQTEFRVIIHLNSVYCKLFIVVIKSRARLKIEHGSRRREGCVTRITKEEFRKQSCIYARLTC